MALSQFELVAIRRLDSSSAIAFIRHNIDALKVLSIIDIYYHFTPHVSLTRLLIRLMSGGGIIPPRPDWDVVGGVSPPCPKAAQLSVGDAISFCPKCSAPVAYPMRFDFSHLAQPNRDPPPRG